MKTTVEVSDMCRHEGKLWCDFSIKCDDCQQLVNCNMRVIALEMILDGEY
jgi:hypothetical protein